MGKDGTQLLRHCVRLLVRVSTDLLAVRLSGNVFFFFLFRSSVFAYIMYSSLQGDMCADRVCLSSKLKTSFRRLLLFV